MTEAERMRPVGGACARLCSPQQRPRPRGRPPLPACDPPLMEGSVGASWKNVGPGGGGLTSGGSRPKPRQEGRHPSQDRSD